MDHGLTARWALLLCVPPLMWAGNAVVGRLMVGHAIFVSLGLLPCRMQQFAVHAFLGRMHPLVPLANHADQVIILIK